MSARLTTSAFSPEQVLAKCTVAAELTGRETATVELWSQIQWIVRESCLRLTRHSGLIAPAANWRRESNLTQRFKTFLDSDGFAASFVLFWLFGSRMIHPLGAASWLQLFGLGWFLQRQMTVMTCGINRLERWPSG